MIIRSLRLKNIKSYGEGPDGNGVIIRFEPGVNRIAGKNGHGKSTLIESLGYALFLTPPVYEEQFDAATYLLRTGKKAGEIEVEFNWEGREYRLERGLGTQNKRRSKVILAEDGSTEAEGDEAVTDYLCRLFRFRSGERFSELFAKLLGVKQGRLAWPFDSKRGEALRHFEPLLDVEIFRQCFEGLKPVGARFEELKHGRETALAAAEERIRERADSPARVQARRLEFETLGGKVNIARTEQIASEQQKLALERQERAYQEAKVALDTAAQQASAATQRRETAQLQVRESEQAVAVARDAQPAFEAYHRAEQELRRLHGEQLKKAQFEKQRGEAERLRFQCEHKASSARQEAAGFSQQLEGKTRDAGEMREQLAAGRQGLAQGAADFGRLVESIEAARRSRDALQHWLTNLGHETQTNRAGLEKVLENWQGVASWNASALAQARAEDQKCDQTARELALKLAETRKFGQTLGLQLDQIRGGLCPFLKEQCRQFDPAKVQSEIASVSEEIERLAGEHDQAAEKHRTSRARLEQLSQQEVALNQNRKGIEHELAGLARRHNQLLPTTALDHFTALLTCLAWADPPALPALPPVDSEVLRVEPGAAVPISAVRGWIEAEIDLREQATRLFDRVSATVGEKFQMFEKQRDDRLRSERDLANQQKNLDKTETEIAQLKEKMRLATVQAEEAEAESARARSRLADLEGQL